MSKVRCPDCDGPLESCAHLGRIPVWAICCMCRGEYMVTLVEGVPNVTRRRT